MTRTRILIKLCLVLFVVQSVSCDWKPNNKEKETLCKTAECKTRGEEYKKNLNTKANPCQDFYTFTCGNWQKNHPGPKYAPVWSIFDVINFDFLSIIRNTVESYNYQLGDDVSFRQVKAAYETCMKIPEYPMKDAKDIAREVTNVGRVPKSSVWDIHTKYLQLSGESALFQTELLGNKAVGSVSVLMLMEPHSAYGSIFHGENWKPQEKQAYSEFLFVIMKSLKLKFKDSDAVIKEKVEKVFEFRKKLGQIIQQNTKVDPESFNPFTGRELNKWFSDTLGTQTTTQNIPWTEVIEALLQSVSPELRRNEKIIAMRHKQYFLDLMELLKNVPEDVLASHMEIYFVERHLKLKENMYKLLEGTSVEPHSLTRYIREKYNPRWGTCLQELNLKEELEKLLYKKWFQKYHTFLVRDMSSRIRTAIEGQIEKCPWLDKSTRTETMKKLDNVVTWVGFPPWIDGVGRVSVRRKQKEILVPKAALLLNLNLIYIHAPLLLPPMFSATIPTLYNYAGIGTTLGHEMYHVIDDCGKYEVGTKKLVWWQPEIRDKCLSRKFLFIEVYNKITDRDFRNRYNIDVKSDTSVSVLENYPDVMGLEAAYTAYTNLANRDKSVCQTLPNFEKYNCDQMFYIAYANTYCGYNTKKWAEKKLARKAMHSLDSIRINGAVAQMKSFATAFGCPTGSPMNPPQKVNLWQ